MEFQNSINPWLPEYWAVPLEEIHAALPKITIGILSYNRKEDLRGTLDCITKAVQYPDVEVIVVDNASLDGSVEMLSDEFPGVIVIPLQTNSGTAARNHIIEKATGEFIFFYDDDSFPATPATIQNIVLFMLKATDVSALNTVVIQYRNFVCESKGWDKYSTKKNSDGSYEGLFVVEGGVCFRTNIIKQFRFDNDNLWGAEGVDLSLQLFNVSRKMILHRWYATLHAKSTSGRPRSSDAFLFSSSMVKMLFKHFHLPVAYLLLCLYCLRRLIGFFFWPKTTKATLQGIADGMKNRKNFMRYTPKIGKKKLFALYKWYLLFLRW